MEKSLKNHKKSHGKVMKVNRCGPPAVDEGHQRVNPSPPLPSARRTEAGVRVRRGIPGEQLHGVGVGQVQRMVPGLQQEGAAQERLADHAAATGSPLHEAPAEGPAGPAGGVSVHHGD